MNAILRFYSALLEYLLATKDVKTKLHKVESLNPGGTTLRWLMESPQSIRWQLQRLRTLVLWNKWEMDSLCRIMREDGCTETDYGDEIVYRLRYLQSFIARVFEELCVIRDPLAMKIYRELHAALWAGDNNGQHPVVVEVVKTFEGGSAILRIHAASESELLQHLGIKPDPGILKATIYLPPGQQKWKAVST